MNEGRQAPQTTGNRCCGTSGRTSWRIRVCLGHHRLHLSSPVPRLVSEGHHFPWPSPSPLRRKVHVAPPPECQRRDGMTFRRCLGKHPGVSGCCWWWWLPCFCCWCFVVIVIYFVLVHVCFPHSFPTYCLFGKDSFHDTNDFSHCLCVIVYGNLVTLTIVSFYNHQILLMLSTWRGSNGVKRLRPFHKGWCVLGYCSFIFIT